MTKTQIACLLYRMKQQGETVLSLNGTLETADELLTKYYGRKVEPVEGQAFIKGHNSELTESEKDQDREWADKVIALSDMDSLKSSFFGEKKS